MLATVTSLGLQGLYCYRVTVEADLVEDGHGFEIVGLPGAAVKESRERVRASLRNGDLSYPDGRITVNLAPADTAKDSHIYDLPVLLALLLPPLIALIRRIPVLRTLILGDTSF